MRDKRILSFIAVVSVVAFVVLIGFNIRNNNNFWDISIFQGVTLIISVFVSYYLIQLKTEERKRREAFERLLLKVYEALQSEEFRDFSNKKVTLINQRRIKNKINIMLDNSRGIDIQNELKYINEEFEKIRDLVSEKMVYDQKLKDDDKHELIKLINNIEHKCDIISFKIHT